MASRLPMLYGTAWKRERSTALVLLALRSGFRGIDVAAQPRHYREDLVGEGVRAFLAESGVKRDALYLQTKFTSVAGQDPDNLPFDPTSTIPEQVHASIASSLRNLRPREAEESIEESYSDCLVIHLPLPTIAQTLQAWATLESYVPYKIRSLGISNTSLSILKTVYQEAQVKPVVVQNRFYKTTGYDVPLRKFCRTHGIVYQSFWTLTGNPKLLTSRVVQSLASKTNTSPEVALYFLVLSLGDVTVLNGTTNQERMKSDLDEICVAREWAMSKENEVDANAHTAQFKALIGDGHME